MVTGTCEGPRNRAGLLDIAKAKEVTTKNKSAVDHQIATSVRPPITAREADWHPEDVVKLDQQRELASGNGRGMGEAGKMPGEAPNDPVGSVEEGDAKNQDAAKRSVSNPRVTRARKAECPGARPRDDWSAPGR